MPLPRIRPLIAALLLAFPAATAAAEMDPATRGLIATGLSPVFPAGVDCPGISSPFASPTRYDGSPRRNELGGIHSGMDISLPVGTPLLALADGEVVHSGSAGRLVGTYVWLHYPPEATGLPRHVFARYQHLDSPSPLAVGTRVAKGDTVALSGNSGTTGGHYGAAGYDHLHLLILVSDTAEFSTRGPLLTPGDFRFLDPVALYLGKPPTPFDNPAVAALPETAKRPAVAAKTTDGRILPEGRRVIWPVACAAR